MFYIWLFSSGFFALSILSQLTLISIGVIPNIINIIMTLALEITTASLMIKKIKEPHKQSYSLKAVGLWFFYYGLFMVFSSNRVQFPLYLAIRIEFGLLIIAIGVLMFYYNQMDQKKIRTKTNYKQLKEVKKQDKLFDLVFEIECLLNNKDVQNNPEFYQNLEKIEEFGQLLSEKKVDVSITFVDQVIELFMGYNKLINEPILTIEVIEELVKIENITKQIKVAFEILYRRSLNKEVDELETQLSVLKSQLQLNGLVKSDFK